MSKIEKELKFKIDDPIKIMTKIGGVKPEKSYIKDEIYGRSNKPKIRKRTIVNEIGKVIVSYEKTEKIKSEITKKTKETKLGGLPKEYSFENGYEKIRYHYKRNDYDIMIDFYAIGIFCEIEGKEETINKKAKELGLKNPIKENIDEYYCNESKKRGQEPNLFWGFGKTW